MMKRSMLVLAAAFLVAPNALAANYPTQAFDAQYQITTAQGNTDMRMASDGKGHFFTQTTADGQKYGTIIDYLNQTSTSLIPQGNMAMQSKLPATASYVGDEASVKQLGGKSIGTKAINGHPCHGFEYTNAGAKTQTWIGDDCKIVVESTTNSSTGKSVMTLKSKAGAPSADVFTVPANYKLMKVN